MELGLAPTWAEFFPGAKVLSRGPGGTRGDDFISLGGDQSIRWAELIFGVVSLPAGFEKNFQTKLLARIKIG